jgi:hypothetical protein
MQVTDSYQADLENTIKMVENGFQILRGTNNLGVASRTLSVIAALIKHQEAKVRALKDESDDEIMRILLRV